MGRSLTSYSLKVHAWLIHYLKYNSSSGSSLILIILLHAFSHSISSQNLIPNPSFENGKCALGYSQKPYHFKVDGWHMPDSGTPDYYSGCGKKGSGVPANWAGVRDPMEGDAYVGIYLKKGKYQENIGLKLREKLEPGVRYYGRFSVASVANAEYFPCEISLAFSSSPLHIDMKEPHDNRQITLPFPSHDEYFDFSWHTLEFSFIATGNENYMYVGSLARGVELCQQNKYQVKKESMLRNAAYVYLDNFYLGVKKEYEPPVSVFEFVDEIEPIKILFNFDEDLLLPGSISTLDSITTFLSSENYHLRITGGTDSLGTDTYNRTLGLKRAESVEQYMVFKGIDNERIGLKSIGEDNPKYPNHSEETRSLNRSALIEFYREKITIEN